MSQRMRFAFIGCGKISQRHFEAIAESPNAEIACVSDLNPDLAKATGERYGVPWFTDHRKMLREAPCDVVGILTPSGSHALLAYDCLEFGKPLVIEKPMTLTLAEANDLVRESRARNVRIFVVHQYRYQPCVQLLSEAVAQGRLGRIFMVSARIRWCRPESYYKQGAWRGTWAMDGGVVSNQAVHHIDLMQWFGGPIASIKAWGVNVRSMIETEDTAVAVFQYESGAIGSLEATTCASPHDIESSLSVLGDKGTVEIDGRSGNRMRNWAFSDQTPKDDEILKEYGGPGMDKLRVGHPRFYEAVIDSIRKDAPFDCDVFAGRRTVETISAIYESMESGEEVKLRFKPSLCRLGRREYAR